MTFDLLPTLTPWIVGILAVAAIGVLMALGVAVAAVTEALESRRGQVRRTEPAPTYRVRSVLSH